MICYGQVRHRFHGNYSMVVVVKFHSETDAKRALPLFPGFELFHRADISTMALPVPDTLIRVAHGRKSSEPVTTRSEVDDVKALIERWRIYPKGARREPIDSVAFSIDVGPVFYLDLTQALIDHHDSLAQLPLFKETA